MQLSAAAFLILLIVASLPWLGTIVGAPSGLGIVVSWLVVSMSLLSLMTLLVAGKRGSSS